MPHAIQRTSLHRSRPVLVCFRRMFWCHHFPTTKIEQWTINELTRWLFTVHFLLWENIAPTFQASKALLVNIKIPSDYWAATFCRLLWSQIVAAYWLYSPWSILHSPSYSLLSVTSLGAYSPVFLTARLMAEWTMSAGVAYEWVNWRHCLHYIPLTAVASSYCDWALCEFIKVVNLTKLWHLNEFSATVFLIFLNEVRGFLLCYPLL